MSTLATPLFWKRAKNLFSSGWCPTKNIFQQNLLRWNIFLANTFLSRLDRIKEVFVSDFWKLFILNHIGKGSPEISHRYCASQKLTNNISDSNHRHILRSVCKQSWFVVKLGILAIFGHKNQWLCAVRQRRFLWKGLEIKSQVTFHLVNEFWVKK